MYAATALLCALFASAFFCMSQPVSAAFNQQINYQGKLTDSSNIAVPDGTYNMRFWLLTSPTIATTSAVWTESLTGGNRVQVTNGLFSVMLGSTTPLTGVDFNQTLYLGVEIGGSGGAAVWDGEMSPRKILGAVPAAFEATQLDGIATSSFLRSDQADTISASTASTLLTITQSGAGDILNIFDGGTEVFSILDGGNVGIGSSSPSSKLTVAGNVLGEYFTSTSTTATSTFAGALSIADTKWLQFTHPSDGGIAIFQNINDFGENDLVFSVAGSPTELVNLAFVAGGSISANSGLTGAGNFTPSLSFNTDGSIQAVNTSQGAAGDRYFEINMTSGARITTGGLRVDAGNVGIGTTTPGTILSLGNTGNNTINISTTATSTFGTGINLRTGCFAINGVCVGSGGITAIGAAGQTSDGPTVTFATSSDTNIGLRITGSGDTQTFTSTWTGTLADARVADNITISGGTIGSNSISGTLTTTGSLTIGDGGDRIDIASNTWDVTNGVITNATWQGNAVGTSYGGTGVSAIPSAGQILIGDDAGFTLATLTDGAGITIDDSTSPGAITITSTLGASVDLASAEVTGVLPDANVADAITISGGTIGSNTISSGSTWSTAGTLTIGDGGDRIDIASNTWDVTNGVLTGGTWQGSAIGVAYGGTGTTTLATGGLLFASSSSLVSQDPTKLYWDNANNRLGIGTSTPSQTLTVQGNIAHLNPVSGDTLGILGESNSSSATADWRIRAEGLHPLSLGAGGVNDYLYITTSGDIGIGTSSPTRLFEVSGTGNQYARVVSMSGNDAGIEFLRVGSGNDWSIRDTGGDLRFAYSSDDLGSATDAFTFELANGGELGIGDSDPDAHLEISANGGAGAFFYISSDDGNDGDILSVSNAGVLHIGSGATTTAANGFDISTGCYAVGGVCIGGNSLDEAAIEAFIFDGDNSGTLSSGTLALDSLSYTGTLDDTNVNDALTISSAGTIDVDAVSGDTSDDDDLDVAAGGTGVSSLTDGGVLLGNGANDLVAMNVLGDGAIIVGDGVTDPVALTAFTSSTGVLLHEAGGLEADVSGYTNGLYGMISGVTVDIDTETELQNALGGLNILVSADIDTCAELILLVSSTGSCGSTVFSASPTLTGTLTAAAANFSGDVTIANAAGLVVGDTSQLTVGGVTHEIQMLGTGVEDSTMLLATFNTTDGTSGGIDFLKSGSGTIGASTVVASGESLGTITWRGTQQTGTFSNTNAAAQIAAFVDGTVTSGSGADMPGRLEFYTTADGSGTLTSRMVIGSTGRVTIAQTLAAGGLAAAAYHQFGSAGTPDGGQVTNASDVYIQDDLEVDGTLYLAGGSGSIVNADVAEVLLTERGREHVLCNGDPNCEVEEEFVKDELEFGDLVCIVEGTAQTIERCTEANSPFAIGFVSETAVLEMGNNPAIGYPIAVAGIALAFVTNENGNVNPGDLLVSSDKDGYAMKAGEGGEGAIIGKAYDFCYEDECRIPVFVVLTDGASGVQDQFESIATSTDPTPGSYAERFFGNLFARVGNWLADAANGIASIFTDRLTTKELCVADQQGRTTCVTKNQLDALIENVASQAIQSGGSTSGGGSQEGSTSGGTQGGSEEEPAEEEDGGMGTTTDPLPPESEEEEDEAEEDVEESEPEPEEEIVVTPEPEPEPEPEPDPLMP